MNVKRFTARNSREALRLVREALGDDAVILSTKPERRRRRDAGDGRPRASPGSRRCPARADRRACADACGARGDEHRAGRRAALDEHAVVPGLRREPHAQAAPGVARGSGAGARPARLRLSCRGGRAPRRLRPPAVGSRRDVRLDDDTFVPEIAPERAESAAARRAFRASIGPSRPRRRATPARRQRSASRLEMLGELRAVKGLIEERFGALAFMEKLQRRPAEARLAQKLLDCGFSPALIRKLAEGLGPSAGDEATWAAQHPGEQPASRRRGRGARGARRRLRARSARPESARRRRPPRSPPRSRHATAPRNLGLITLDAYRDRRPRAAARLRPHPRRAGAHGARPRVARGPARAARGQEDGPDRYRRHGAARHAHARAARHAVAQERPAPARRQRGVAGRDDRGRAGRLPRAELRRHGAEQARRGDQARAGARRRDPPRAQRRRHRQRAARPRGLASPVGQCARAARDARRRQRRLEARRRRSQPRLRRLPSERRRRWRSTR